MVQVLDRIVVLKRVGISCLQETCILAVDDGGKKRRRGNAVPEQISRSGCFPDHGGVLFGSVYMNMMFINDEGLGNDMKAFVDLFRQLFIAFRE